MPDNIETRGIKIIFDADDALRGQEKLRRDQDKSIKKNEELRDSNVKLSKGVDQTSQSLKRGAVQVSEYVKAGGKITPEIQALIKQFNEAGASLAELSKQFGLSIEQVAELTGREKELLEIQSKSPAVARVREAAARKVAQTERLASREKVSSNTLAQQLTRANIELSRTRARLAEAEAKAVLAGSRVIVQQLKNQAAAERAVEKAAKKKAEAQRLRPTTVTATLPVIGTTFTDPLIAGQSRLATETDRTTVATGRQGVRIGGLVKKMALWAIGLRSVWFAYIRVRRAMVQAVREIFENTKEAERLSEAWTNLKRNLVLALVPFEDGLEFMRQTAKAMDDIAKHSSLMADQTAGDAAAGAKAMEALGEKSAEAMVIIEGFLAVLPPGAGESTKALIGLATRAGVFGEKARLAAEGAAQLARENSVLQRETGLAVAALDEESNAIDKLRDSMFSIQERGLRDLLEAEKQYTEDSEQLWIDFEQGLSDIVQDGWDRRDEITLNGVRRMATIARQIADRRGAIDRQLNRRLQDIELQAQDQSVRNAFNHRQRLLDIERRYRDELRDIERKYSDSIGDAIARRDATAALKAIRERDRGLEDAERTRDEGRSDASADFNQQNREQAQQLERQRQAARRAHARQLADLEIARGQQERELRISLEQQVEDLQESLEDQEQDLNDSYDRQFNDVVNHFVSTRYEVSRQNIFDAMLAQNEYINRERALDAHLRRMAIIRRQYSTGTGTTTGPGFAEGGQFIASGTTRFVAGEGSQPEMVTITPLGAGGSGSVGHSVSGSVTHDIDVAVSRSIDGMAGQITAAVQGALSDLLR